MNQELVQHHPLYLYVLIIKNKFSNKYLFQNVTKAHYGDWKRHLAVILANRTDTNANFVDLCVKTMGDTLGK